MPMAFPSHQGLILPLWRRFPSRIDGVALCVGAAMPDVVDAAAWPLRGELGQWLGHSLVGIVVCVPFGLALTWLSRRLIPRALRSRLDAGAPSSPGVLRAGLSIAIGTVSHDAFDFITHGNFRFLWPWYCDDHAFPSWWYHTWGYVPLPVYREPYPLAPHTIAWVLLTIIGAVLFVRCLSRRTESVGHLKSGWSNVACLAPLVSLEVFPESLRRQNDRRRLRPEASMHPESLGHDPNELLAHSAWVRALARSLLADDSLADDVVQDTWTATLGRAPRNPGRVRAWLAGIASNLARGQRRERARRAARELAYAVPERTPSTAEIVEQEAERKRVVDIVLKLSEPYRETLLLRFWCDLDPAVIAVRAGIPASTVRNRLRRALAQVRTELERERPGQTQRTLQILIALSAPGPVACQLATVSSTLASVIGVLAMTAKIKLLTAVAVVGIAGVASWALLPHDQRENAPPDARARHVAEVLNDHESDHPSAPARNPLASEPDAVRSPVSASEPMTPLRGTATRGIVVLGAVTNVAGDAIDGASIWLRNPRGEERTTTTQDGMGFVLARLTPGEWEVGCHASKYRDAVRTVTLAQAQEQIDFTLEPAVMLGVRLVTPDGKPLLKELAKGEYEVSFLLRDGLFPIATVAAPGATIPWISAGEPFGVARLEPQASKDRPGCDWVLQCDAPLPLHVSLVLRDRVLTTQRVEAPATEVSLVVSPSEVHALATTLRLKVLDALNGQPIDTASLSLGNGKSTTSGGNKAKADGSFELLHQPFGMLALWIHAKGYEQRFVYSSPAPGAVLDLGTIELARAASISGRVTSPSGGCDAYLHVWPLDALKPHLPLMTQIVFYSTASDGSFDAQVGAGRQLLIVRPRTGEGAVATMVDVSAAAPVRDLEIAVRPGVRVTIAPELEGGTVLRIVDAQGLPLWAELVARERRTVNLSAGKYTLEAHTERGMLKAVPFVVGDQPLSVRIGL